MGSVWTVLQQTSQYVTLLGPLAGRHVGSVFPLVTAIAKLVDEQGQSYCAKVHQAMYDSNPQQTESLISIHQALRIPGNAIDDRSTDERDIRGNPGTQSSRLGQHILPFFFDGSKCYYKLFPITDAEASTLPSVTFSSDMAYDISSTSPSRRLPSTSSKVDWKYNLGFPPDHVVEHTLKATTQLVATIESETREMMRDHFKTRIPELKYPRRSDTACLDTFFSSIKSVRGYTCWNLFCFKESGLDFPILMRRRSQSPSTLLPFIQECGIPKILRSDNAPEFKSDAIKRQLAKFQIDTEFTEPHHPNENLAERRGGMLKSAVVHLLQVTGAPVDYWCFALEYVAHVRSFLARRRLNWRTPYERHFGDTPDISVFRFAFWSPVWYYTPRAKFPQSKMLPARFIGIAKNAGDAFCYLILTDFEDETKPPRVLTRSVVRQRYPQQQAPIVKQKSTKGDRDLIFFKSDGKTILPSVDDPDINTEMSQIPSDPGKSSHTLPEVSPDPVDHFDSSVLEVYGPVLKRPRLNGESTQNTSNPNSSILPKSLESPQNVSNPSKLVESHLPKSLESTQKASNPSKLVESVHFDSNPNESNLSNLVESRQNDSNQLKTVKSVQNESNPDDSKQSFSKPSLVTDVEVAEEFPVDDVNTALLSMVDCEVESDLFDCILSHTYQDGILMATIKWSTGDNSEYPFHLVKQDFPLQLAEYIRRHSPSLDSDVPPISGKYKCWSQHFLCSYQKIIH